jgi:hypothetical protein
VVDVAGCAHDDVPNCFHPKMMLAERG